MRVLTSSIVVTLALLSSCATSDQKRFKAGKGDPGQFILQQALARGRQPVTTTGLPVLQGSWRYSEDKNGIIIRLPRQDCESVEKFLFLAFGAPAFGPNDTKDGGRIGVYSPTSSGGAIQFVCHAAEGTQVILLRHMTVEEFSNGLKMK